MGPRPEGRGEPPARPDRRQSASASMGPRPEGRGERAIRNQGGPVAKASMGPRPEGRGELLRPGRRKIEGLGHRFREVPRYPVSSILQAASNERIVHLNVASFQRSDHFRELPAIPLSKNRSKLSRQAQTTIGSRPITSIGRPIASISLISRPSVGPRSMKTTWSCS